MEKLKVYIEDCPINSFKLTGEETTRYQDEALERARELYLDLHDEAYRALMFKDFNALWTPDRHATNDIDPKDGFWSMYVFLFNAGLVKILSEKFDLKIIDQTGSEFRNQKHFYEFLRDEGIQYTINEKKRNNTSFKHSLKVFVKKIFLNTKEYVSKAIFFLKKELAEKSRPQVHIFNKDKPKKIIYLAIPNVKDKDIKPYLDRRYKKILQQLKEFEKQGAGILLVTMKDYKELNNYEFPSINIMRLLDRNERLRIFATSVLYKMKVLTYVGYELLTTNDPIRKYFFKNIPTNLYFPLKENRAFHNLFSTFGPGLWIMKGPIVYKGINMRNYNARKNGVRSLTVSGRVMTSLRLTNSFLKSHTNTNGRYPDVLPHAMLVTDRISYETIRNQTDKIEIYITKMIDRFEEDNSCRHQPFSIALVLQKKNEIESMVDTVLSAIQNFDDVILNLKVHPDNRIPDRTKKKYREKPGLNILPLQTSLSEAVEISDLCISSYSSSVFEFANCSKPIIWLNNVTLNSLLFKDVQRKIGFIANDVEELKQLIQKMKNDDDFYQKMKREHHTQFLNFVNDIDGKENVSFKSVIENELEKV